MFNSKFFSVIVILTVIILGVTVYLQMREMGEYKLLNKLKNKYFAAAPAAVSDQPVKDDKKPETVPAAVSAQPVKGDKKPETVPAAVSTQPAKDDKKPETAPAAGKGGRKKQNEQK